jgi:sugar O-acyltransferase (sialic acid O-acetyltransferase NeuD family)
VQTGPDIAWAISPVAGHADRRPGVCVTALRVVIFGVGDFARVAAQYLYADSPHDVVAFTVHERHLPQHATLCGLPVVAFEELDASHPPETCALFVAVGFSRINRERAEIVAECGARGFRLISYVSSGAAYWRATPIGANTFIFEHTVIQPFVTIGDDVILWSGTHVGHDVTIGDHVFVASHAAISGNCTIGAYSFVGVNATIREGVTIAPRCVIGDGAVVTRDTDEGDIVAVSNTRLFPTRSWELDGF